MSNELPHRTLANTAHDIIQSLQFPEMLGVNVNSEELKDKLANAKAAAVNAQDSATANLLWVAEAIESAQSSFQNSFGLIKANQFYDAWCELERCEIAVDSIKRHFTGTPEDFHRIDYIQRMIERWQSLYPYKVFFSPEILKRKVECSICDAIVSLRNPCGHEKGEIYNGEQCIHRVVDCEFLGFSIVDDPVQKYSVAFLSSEDGSAARDHYNYDVIRYVADRVSSAYHEWKQEVGTRATPIEKMSHLSADTHCPCASGNAFRNCCAAKSHVKVPHIDIIFSVIPPAELMHDMLPF